MPMDDPPAGVAVSDPVTCRWVDGQPAGVLPVDDRGLQFGDGLFETFAVLDGLRPCWERHRERLQAGCWRLGFPDIDWPALEDELTGLLGPTRGLWLAKLILTRGDSPRGYRIPEGLRPRRILSLHPWPRFPASHWEEGVEVRPCSLKLASQPALAGLKHLNRLENVLARAEWALTGIQEGLLLDQADLVVEGTMSNVFLRRDATVFSHPLTESGVAGVMRAWVLQQLELLGIACRLEGQPLARLAAADEVWLCNSVFGLWPVRGLLGPHPRVWSPGELTQDLQRRALAAFPWHAQGYRPD